MVRSARQLEERLIAFAVGACRIADRLPKTTSAQHIARQLTRSATSPAANYAEGCAAGSRRDFVHKLRLVLKELQESRVWLELAQGLGLKSPPELAGSLRECGELIAIFVTSIKTAEGNLHGEQERAGN